MRALFAAALAATLLVGCGDERPYDLKCKLNNLDSGCRVTSLGEGAFRLEFGHREKPIFSFYPSGPLTTDGRLYRDSTGQEWSFTGHHSFVMEEVGGYGNRIEVEVP